MALSYFVTFLITLVLIQGRTEVERLSNSFENPSHISVYANALSKAHYNPWTCKYSREPGYRCVSCSAALHCYPGDFALLVQCAGFLPFCRNGYCSRFKTGGCNENYTYAEGTHGPLQMTTAATLTTSASNLTTEVSVTDVSSPNTNTTEEMTSSSTVDEIGTSTVTAEPTIQK